jgi:hypothetical protein
MFLDLAGTRGRPLSDLCGAICGVGGRAIAALAGRFGNLSQMRSIARPLRPAEKSLDSPKRATLVFRGQTTKSLVKDLSRL